MASMHRLKENLERELEKFTNKTTMSSNDLETVSKLLMSIKNIDKIERYEDEHSMDGGMWRAEGGYSNRRKRDARGRYMSYSMHDAKRDMLDDLHEMLQMDALTPSEHDILKRAIEQLER